EGGDIAQSRDDAPIKGRSLDEGEEAAKKGSDDTEEMGRSLDEGEEAAKKGSDDTEEMSSVLPPIVDEPASPLGDDSQDEPASLLRDVSQGEACPTISSLDAEQDRANIAKTSTLPHKSTSRVPSFAADEGNSSCWRMEKEEVHNDLEMMPQSRGGATVLSSGVVEVPTAGPPAAEVPTGSDVVPTAAKYLQEYHQFATELPIERRIELISDLVRYQDNYAKVHKYQTLQRKPRSKKQKKDYYMAVIKGHAGWKVV
nr:hypothetical protein [Tanacetum cinerariifolium]